MDDLQDLSVPPAMDGPPSPPPEPQEQSSNKSKRKQHDHRYEQTERLRSLLPAQARDARIAIYRARPGTEIRGSSRPLERILLQTWEDQQLSEQDVLAAYLEETYGPGGYVMEPQDEYNKKINKLPSWYIAAGDPKDPDFDQADAADLDDTPLSLLRGRRPRRARMARNRHPQEPDMDDDLGPLDDFDDEAVPGANRDAASNLYDFLTTKSNLEEQNRMQAANQNQNMMQMMQMMDMQRRQEEKEERRAERERELKREELKAEERRREEEEKREERRCEEERRREEMKREEDRRHQDFLRQQEAATKRIELISSAIAAAISVLPKLLERGPNPIEQAMVSQMQNRDADPIMMMLLKHVFEKDTSEQGVQSMVQMMSQMSQSTTQMMIENMKASFQQMSEFQQQQMQQQLKMALANPNTSEEQKSTIQEILETISGAGELLGTIMGNRGQGQQQQALPMQPMQPSQQPMAPQQQPQQPQPQPPQPQQPQPVEVPEGIPAVGGALQALQAQAYTTEQEYQGLIKFMIDNMPLDLKQAVVNGDKTAVFTICAPTFMQNEELKTWIMQPGVEEWIMQFLGEITPFIEQTMQAQQPQTDVQEIDQTEQQPTQPPVAENGTVPDQEQDTPDPDSEFD